MSKKGKKEMKKIFEDSRIEVDVRMGRGKKKLSEILNIEEGSIIVLDKLAGEALDIYVGGNLVARGEPIVMEENFGIRVTEIVKG